MLGPVRFELGGSRSISPLHIAPWGDDARWPGLMRALRGEWPCLPFGTAHTPSGLPQDFKLIASSDDWNHGYLKSHDSASSRPPPSAFPEKHRDRRDIKFRNTPEHAISGPNEPASHRFSVDIAPLPDIRTTTKIRCTCRADQHDANVLASSICATARSILASISNVSALCRVGRLSVIVAMPASMSKIIVESDI